MGLFNKKEKREEKAPSLPGLPKLPELPEFEGTKQEEPLHQLPSFPNSSFGSKFSQNAIKDAVTGKKEDDKGSANDFEQEEARMMPEPVKRPRTHEIQMPPRSPLNHEIEEEIPEEFEDAAKIVKNAEPVFVRLDKFEESMKIFKDARDKIIGIESILRDIEKVKEEEELQLESWKKEIQSIKRQIEKIDRDIFSKIE